MAPCASKAFLIFSASSLGMPSLSTFGTDSTNFFASMRVRFGTIALTSLMTLGLEPASKDSSFTLKIVFSLGLTAANASSLAAASSAPAPPAAPAGAAAPAAGKAISWMFRRDLRSVTRSEAWRSVRVDMSSTILCNVGSEGKDVPGSGVVELESGGGGGEDDDDGEDGNGGDGDEDVAVASVRTRTDDRVLH